MSHQERHRTENIGWLRAAVLGANDGFISIASLPWRHMHAMNSGFLTRGVRGLFKPL
jgi:VIT1/CCC1 family predicted Fe2+/Mn2+ transporter